ncbi:hypothetical protein ACWGOE_07345 [Leucobacter chromiiresistens]
MSFDIEQAQRGAARRLRDKLDADVNAARARIRRYTATEHAEAAAGLRLTERQLQLRRATAGFEALGQAYRGLVDTLLAASRAFDRGFQNGER